MNEVTELDPEQEQQFQRWARQYGITDVDHPESFYDYRGYWKETGGAPHTPGEHFPDTYKQHGHPRFSAESQYSRGLWDGGQWIGEDTLVAPPMPAPFLSHRYCSVPLPLAVTVKAVLPPAAIIRLCGWPVMTGP